MPDLLKSLDEQLTENLEQHGHYLTDPHAADEERLNERIDALAVFVLEDQWPHVREQLLRVIRASQAFR